MHPQPSTPSVRWREILIFIILAYGLSWAWWLALILSGAQTFSNLSQMNSDEAQAAQITIAIGNFGPLLAALVMRMFISREGLRGSIGWKRPFKFYLLAILTPILFFCILATFNHLTGLGRFAWTRADMPLGAYLGVELLIGAFIISISFSAKNTAGAATSCHAPSPSAKCVAPFSSGWCGHSGICHCSWWG
jgi:hypothetical protein